LEIISRLDHELRYIYLSPNLAGIFGSATAVFLGKRPVEVAIPDYDWSGFETRRREAIDKRQATVHEFQYRGRHYRTRIIPEYSSGGGVESVMSITEDFTERLRAELELRKLYRATIQAAGRGAATNCSRTTRQCRAKHCRNQTESGAPGRSNS